MLIVPPLLSEDATLRPAIFAGPPHCPHWRPMLFCARPAPAGGRPSSEKRFSRSFHDRPQAVCRHGPVVCFAKPAGAGGLYRRHLCQRAALVLGAAAVHEDGAAPARRLAGGVVGGDGVLPVAAARWLFLCAFPDANPQP